MSPLNTPFDNPVVPPSLSPDGTFAATRGGFPPPAAAGAPAGTLNSPFDNAIYPSTSQTSETPNSQSGMPTAPTTISVPDAPGAGTTIALPDMTTTPDPKLG